MGYREVNSTYDVADHCRHDNFRYGRAYRASHGRITEVTNIPEDILFEIFILVLESTYLLFEGSFYRQLTHRHARIYEMMIFNVP